MIRPCASTVIFAEVYEPAATAVSARAIVPVLVIVPPVSPVPTVMLVTLPLAVTEDQLKVVPSVVKYFPVLPVCEGTGFATAIVTAEEPLKVYCHFTFFGF